MVKRVELVIDNDDYSGGFLSVEVAMAVLGCAFEGFECDFGSDNYELVAVIMRMTSDANVMILEALSLPSLEAVVVVVFYNHCCWRHGVFHWTRHSHSGQE